MDDTADKHEDIPANIEQSMTNVEEVHGSQSDIGHCYRRYSTNGLEEDRFRGQRQEERPGGLEGIEEALED